MENFIQSPKLELVKIQLNDEYRKKWNIHLDDFYVLSRNGEVFESTLYREGGFKPNLNDEFFLLLMQIESYYDDVITKDELKKPHLKQCFCIVDKNGSVRRIFKNSEIPYIIKNSVIYSVNGKYYNIETNEYYCETNTYMNSSDFLFLENKWDKNQTKGVLKIHKKTGKFEVFE